MVCINERHHTVQLLRLSSNACMATYWVPPMQYSASSSSSSLLDWNIDIRKSHKKASATDWRASDYLVDASSSVIQHIGDAYCMKSWKVVKQCSARVYTCQCWYHCQCIGVRSNVKVLTTETLVNELRAAMARLTNEATAKKDAWSRLPWSVIANRGSV